MKVFVYGTLKRGYGNNVLLRDSTFVEEKVLSGFKLYNAGFPVAYPSENESIQGEIWDIGDNEQTLHNLDRLENNGRMYHRTRIEDEDISLYVGDKGFWGNFERLRECPKTANVYTWPK